MNLSRKNLDVENDLRSNPMLAQVSATLVRSMEFLSLRGAPTILNALWKVRALRRTMATATLAGGQTIVFPAFDPYWCRYVWANAPYEEDVEQIFTRIGPGRVLVDCGANIGYWSIRAREFGFTEVIAIEANRELLPILRRNFHVNDIPGTVLHAAVYSSSGERLFLDHTEAHAIAGIGQRGIPVTSITIADAVKDLGKDQEIVVKLDVEGAEIPALRGAEDVQGALFVYEDFLKRDMIVTRYLLGQEMTIFGVSSEGRHSRIGTADDALAFSSANSRKNAPTNLVACRSPRAAQLEQELSRAP
jgi:FkbM family methyltransferase